MTLAKPIAAPGRQQVRDETRRRVNDIRVAGSPSDRQDACDALVDWVDEMVQRARQEGRLQALRECGGGRS